MYLKFIFSLIVYGIAYLLGMILHPFVYAMRNRKRPGGFLWWWANWDEEGGGDPEIAFIDNWYGVYELIPDDRDAQGNVIKDKYDKFREMNSWQKYWLSYNWVALRNSHWNLKKLLFPFEGPWQVYKERKFEGDSGPIIWRNGTIGGISWVIITDRKYRKSFRFSRTWGKTKGKYLYIQLGAGDSRYHFKMRRGKLGADNKSNES